MGKAGDLLFIMHSGRQWPELLAICAFSALSSSDRPVHVSATRRFKAFAPGRQNQSQERRSKSPRETRALGYDSIQIPALKAPPLITSIQSSETSFTNTLKP